MNRPLSAALLCALSIALAATARAGPPFITDDPETVEFQHWEIYLASMVAHDSGGWSGTAPHLEINFGAVPNLQLHILAPLSFSAPKGAATQYGYGDTELGAKFRFIEENDHRPQVGIFPLVELPSGNAVRGLGNGRAQIFLPIWLQKSFGPWTTYGGGGYWLSQGEGNRNWWYAGWLVQRKITKQLTLGTEIFHETRKSDTEASDTKINAGGMFDFSDHWHLLFTAGHTVQGPSSFLGYLGLQYTFGPEKKSGGK